MARTNIKGTQVFDGSVTRSDLNTTTSGSAVITKVVEGNGISIADSTGIDSGTGDVTIEVDLSYLDSKYPSLVTGRTQNQVLAAPSSGSGSAAFRSLVAGDIPALAISGVTGLQTALDGKLSGSGTSGYLSKYTGGLSHGNSVLFESGGNIIIGSSTTPTARLSFQNNIASLSGSTVAINLKEGVTAGSLPAYGIGFGNFSLNGFTDYRSGTVSANYYGHRFIVNNVVIGTFEGDGTLALGQNATGGVKLRILDYVGQASAESVAIDLRAGSTSGGLPAYGIGFGPLSTEGYITYRSGTGSNSLYGHKFYVNNAEVARFRGDGAALISAALGIGATSVNGYSLRVSSNLSASGTAYAIVSEGQVQSAVTTAASYFRSVGSTQAASYTLGTLNHFIASQGTFGAGSTVTNQYGFRVESTLTGATNNYGFYSNIAAATNAWNLYVNGTASNYMAGSLGIGASSLSDRSLAVGKNIAGASTAYGIISFGTVQSGVSIANLNLSQSNLASGVTASIYHYAASQGTISGTLSNQYGFAVNANMTGGANNYAFYSDLAAASGRWNLYLTGTANNYLAGGLGIGTTSLNTSLDVVATSLVPIFSTTYGGGGAGGVMARRANGTVSSPTTLVAADLIGGVLARGYNGSAFTSLSNGGIYIYAGETWTTGANGTYLTFETTANTGTSRTEKLRITGSGDVGIGTTSPSYKLDVNGTGRFAGAVQFDAIPSCSVAPSGSAHLTNKAYVDSLSFVKRGDTVKTASFSNLSLSGTQTVSGVALIASDLILVSGQTTGSQNGVYVVAAGAWSRSGTNDSDSEIRGAYHYITAGTYANQRYINTNASSITVGTTAITYGVDFGAETDPVWGAFQTANDITSTRIGHWNEAYDNRISTKTTTNLAEGSNLYFTTSRVLATALTGFTLGSSAVVASTDTVLQAFQKLQAQVDSRFAFGGNSAGANLTIGTNDNYDLSIERNNVSQIDLLSTGIRFNADINLTANLKISGSAGADHQFVKSNGSSTAWSYLNTGELSDKTDIVMLGTYEGERGFKMYSQSTQDYAECFVFTNPDAGVSLGLYGYTLDASDALKEFGIHLSTDGNLYHQKLDGSRVRIATMDMLGGGSGGSWNGGLVTSDISLNLGLEISWAALDTSRGSAIRFQSVNYPNTTPNIQEWLDIYSNYQIHIEAKELITISTLDKLYISGNKIYIQNKEIDFSGFATGKVLKATSSTKAEWVTL